ncbi:scarecrow-like protein 9 [Rhodamnia argentea]|uniref:Scarecrow-like protein 9 n=1 Tax=Rhodamnia argentea TaxID=178133 RepID=A0A8B8N5E2_9MYRT|nr:scarecrow-like protein 9 [Rhodamnia argentea]
MDRPPDEFSSFIDGYVVDDGDDAAFSIFPEDDLVSRLTIDDMFDKFSCSYTYAPPLGGNLGKEPAEDYDFSDAALKYINQMLMEEDIEEKSIVCHEASALEAAEKSFYEVIGERYPPAADQHPSPSRTNESSCNSCTSAITLVESEPNCESQEHLVSQSISSPIDQSLGGVYLNITTAGHAESPVSAVSLPELIGSESVMQFKGNGEEARESLAFGNEILVYPERGEFSFSEQTEECTSLIPNLENNENIFADLGGYRGKKNPLQGDVNLEEGRASKHLSVYTESTVRSEMFDTVLLNRKGSEAALREALRNGMQNGKPKAPNEGKARGKKQGRRKRDVVDLTALLTLCAQAVNMDDRGSSGELLKQIRRHASPTGDGMERMAHYFATGLEARLAGSGSQIYKALMARPTSVVDILKAYHLFLAACPFKKLSNFFSNKTIMNVAGKAPKLHIIDFGILYGFQWPGLIERLSLSPGGPPKLRITGIDLPQPGFKPEEIVEETGRRLASYAKTFNVPFKFNAIAKNWDAIKVEELDIHSDEILVVNCIYRLHHILDDTVVAESPRDFVLNLIRKMNPAVLIQGVINGGHGVPFFSLRFRAALFHYSAIFDMLDATVPRDAPERLLLEREILGRQAMNVIACEGSERIERPETYKMSHSRNLRAGFRQLPLDKDMVSLAKERLKSYYHKDFEIEEDGQWLLQGWKGRIVYALSTWRPDC